MKSQFTKGPWDYNGGDNYSIDIILPNNTTISIDRSCRYTGKYVIEREEMEANARIVAASPEMFIMLVRMKDALLELMDHQDGWENDYVELDALIKKATEQ